MRDEQLENDLIEVINKNIKLRQVHPQTVSHTLTLMAMDTLDFLAWLPQNLQCVYQYLEDAETWYDGTGKPCLVSQQR